jgi:hypothetical protein
MGTPFPLHSCCHLREYAFTKRNPSRVLSAKDPATGVIQADAQVKRRPHVQVEHQANAPLLEIVGAAVSLEAPRAQAPEVLLWAKLISAS